MEQPIFVRISIRVTQRRMYDHDFVIRNNSLTKGIFAVAVIEWTVFFKSKADKELNKVTAEDGSIAIGFRPDADFVVAKNNNTRFCTKWEKILVFIDS